MQNPTTPASLLARSASRPRSSVLGAAAPLLLAIACSGGTDADDLNKQYGQGGGAGSGVVGQAGSETSGAQPGVGGSDTTTAGTGTGTGATGSEATGGAGGTGGSGPAGGSAGAVTAGGSTTEGGAPVGGSGGSGGSAVEAGPYAPRTGSFKMLVYSQNVTGGYKHPSIPEGQQMLKNIGLKQGFEVTVATDDSEITEAGLAKYEIVFFMNSTGEIFSNQGREAYQNWIQNNGAYAGVHSATDTANSWAFYKEMTGQYYDLHDQCCASADIRWTTDGESHITVKGLPSPWTRSEEWYKFNKYSDWSTKAGFKILSTVTTNGGGTRPVSYVREWGNFRAFYTSLGHESSTFQDAQVIKHITAGIMWAVRREALIK